MMIQNSFCGYADFWIFFKVHTSILVAHPNSPTYSSFPERKTICIQTKLSPNEFPRKEECDMHPPNLLLGTKETKIAADTKKHGKNQQTMTSSMLLSSSKQETSDGRKGGSFSHVSNSLLSETDTKLTWIYYFKTNLKGRDNETHFVLVVHFVYTMDKDNTCDSSIVVAVFGTWGFKESTNVVVDTTRKSRLAACGR